MTTLSWENVNPGDFVYCTKKVKNYLFDYHDNNWINNKKPYPKYGLVYGKVGYVKLHLDVFMFYGFVSMYDGKVSFVGEPRILSLSDHNLIRIVKNDE